MNIPKIEEAITLLYQTFIEDKDVAKQRGIAITAMNEMVKLLGGDDVVKKIEAVPYSARLRMQHLFEDAPHSNQSKGTSMTLQEIQEPPWVVKLVADAVAKEREACAKVCEHLNSTEDYYGERIELFCAEAIRARGET